MLVRFSHRQKLRWRTRQQNKCSGLTTPVAVVKCIFTGKLPLNCPSVAGPVCSVQKERLRAIRAHTPENPVREPGGEVCVTRGGQQEKAIFNFFSRITKKFNSCDISDNHDCTFCLNCEELQSF